MKKGRYFIRIFDLYTATVFVYTLLIFFIVIFLNGQYINRQIAHDKQSILLQVKQKGDMTFSIAYKLTQQLTLDKDLINYVNEETPYSTLTLFHKISKGYASYSEAGFNISIMLEGAEEVITKDGLIGIDTYIRDISLDLEDFTRGLLSLDGNKKYYVLKNPEKKAFTIMLKERVTNDRNVIFYLTIYDMMDLPNISDSEDFAIYNDRSFIMGTNSFLSEQDSEQIMKANPEKPLRAGQYTIYSENSSIFSDFRFVYASKIAFISVETILIAVLCFIIMMIIGVVISLKGSKFLYKPVREILSQLNKEDVIEDEIDYIAQISIDIKKTNERLLEDLKVKDNFLKNKYLYDLGMGMLSDENIENLSKQFGWERFNTQGCTAAILDYNKFSDDTEENVSREFINNIRLSIYYTIKGDLSGKHGIEVFEINNYRYGLLFPSKECGEIEKILYEKINELQNKYKIGFSAAIGNPYESIYDASNSMRDAMYAFEYIYSVADKQIITQNDIKNITFSNYYFPLDIESCLLSYIRDGNWNKGEILLKSILDKNLRELPLGKDELTEFKFAIVSTIKRSLQIKNKSTSQVFGEGNILYLELNMCNDNQELYGKIMDLFSRVFNFSINSSDNSLIEKIIEYIGKNYANDISLFDISKEFSVSTYYVSRLFRTKMNLNFKDYYNNYRITKAIEKIKENKNMKISDLSAELGFNSSESFNRVFKKYTGVSPGTYKKKL